MKDCKAFLERVMEFDSSFEYEDGVLQLGPTFTYDNTIEQLSNLFGYLVSFEKVYVGEEHVQAKGHEDLGLRVGSSCIICCMLTTNDTQFMTGFDDETVAAVKAVCATFGREAYWWKAASGKRHFHEDYLLDSGMTSEE